MKGAVADSAIAEESDANAVQAEQFEAVSRSRALKNARGPTMPLVPIKPVSGAKRCMLPPRPCEQPVALPKSSAATARGLTPLASACPWPAMRAEHYIVAAQSGADAGRYRLFADVGVAGPRAPVPFGGRGRVALPSRG